MKPNPDEILDENENDAMMTDYLSHKTPDMNWKNSKPYSVCCGAQATGEQMDLGLCPDCLEPTEFEWEEDLPEEDERETDRGWAECLYTREKK